VGYFHIVNYLNHRFPIGTFGINQKRGISFPRSRDAVQQPFRAYLADAETRQTNGGQASSA